MEGCDSQTCATSELRLILHFAMVLVRELSKGFGLLQIVFISDQCNQWV